ncbi:MAG TPA: murein biosynthesis integral membrane protein MurJ [Phycisphaerales bacterium]|nr:murein biosynthesis integral membrane protein MurJ [Phycisphaerales bacterium]
MPTPGQDGQPAPAPAHDAHAHHVGFLAAAIRVVSGLTLLSRFAGLARDVLTARLFGDGAVGSAFRAAYALPNFFRRLFGEGALSAAFLPEYTLLVRDDPHRASALASRVVYLVALATGAITLLAEGGILLRLALWPAGEELTMSLRLIMLMLPMMPLVCITAVMAGMLQAHGRFAVPAAGPIVLNLFQIAAGALFYVGVLSGRTLASYVVGAAAVLATAATVLWSLHALRGKVTWTRGFLSAHEAGKRVLQRFIPAVLGLGTLQLNTMIDTVIAMWPMWIGATMFGHATPLDKGSNAILSYTQTLYQFPLGVFGIAVATAVFPLLSRASDKPDEFLAHLRRGVRLSLFIGLPASIGLILVRHDLVGVIFGGGRKSFTDDGLARCAAVLLGFAPAVWVYSLNHVLTRAYYAKGDTRTPMRIAIACVGLNITLNFTLIWSLREAGLAWATACSAAVQCVLLQVFLYRRLSVRLWDADTLRAVARTLLVALLMGACVVLVFRLFPPAERWSQKLPRLAACVAAGGLSYAALALLLRTPELRWLTRRAPAGAGKDGMGGMSFE